MKKPNQESLGTRRKISLDLSLSSPSSSSSSETETDDQICNLDLTLSTPLPLPLPLPLPTSICNNNGETSRNEEKWVTGKSQRMTLIYDGKISVCEATDDQARRILKQAEEEQSNHRRGYHSVPASPSISHQLYSPNGVSMKRSLEQFLQKRRVRIQSSKLPCRR